MTLVLPDAGLHCPECGATPAPGARLCLGCQDAKAQRAQRAVYRSKQRRLRRDRARSVYASELEGLCVSDAERDRIIDVIAGCFAVSAGEWI